MNKISEGSSRAPKRPAINSTLEQLVSPDIKNYARTCDFAQSALGELLASKDRMLATMFEQENRIQALHKSNMELMEKDKNDEVRFMQQKEELDRANEKIRVLENQLHMLRGKCGQYQRSLDSIQTGVNVIQANVQHARNEMVEANALLVQHGSLAPRGKGKGIVGESSQVNHDLNTNGIGDIGFSLRRNVGMSSPAPEIEEDPSEDNSDDIEMYFKDIPQPDGPYGLSDDEPA